MSKTVEVWWSDRLRTHVHVARWGSWGTPVLLFPTAGGDAEEVERNGLVRACDDLLAAGRVKLYSVDSIAGRVMTDEGADARWRLSVLNAYHQALRSEVVPLIHADSGGQELPIITAGASIGAFNAVALMCRYPDVVTRAIGMSGTYDLQRFYGGAWSDDLFFSSPLHFVPGLSGPQLDLLRTRFAILASGEGQWEDIGESWRMGDALGRAGVPNRIDSWGPQFNHQWPTWHRMLPQYLDELT